LHSGAHVITARVTDAGGRSGQAQITVNVANIPAVTITAPTDGAGIFQRDLPVRLTARAVDVEDGDISSRLQWSSDRDGALASGDATLGTGASRTVTLTEGTHTITATVTDQNGGVGQATLHLTITPTAPVVTITAPAAGTRIFGGLSLGFAGAAQDATDGNLT